MVSVDLIRQCLPRLIVNLKASATPLPFSHRATLRIGKPRHVRPAVASSIERGPDAKGSHRPVTDSGRKQETKSGELPMNYLVGCRDIELLCRRRAALDREHSWKWLGEAERWRNHEHREVSSRVPHHPLHPGPMAMGPNTINGDLHK
jgi:hypothetical protein